MLKEDSDIVCQLWSYIATNSTDANQHFNVKTDLPVACRVAGGIVMHALGSNVLEVESHQACSQSYHC